MATEASDTQKVDAGGERGNPSPDDMRRELEEQYNVQRARMKELFLQKEEDMQQILLEKQQLESEALSLREEVQQLTILSANQQSELQNLQLLVSETVEASSSGSEEARRLRARAIDLEQQLTALRQQQQELSLAPATLVRSLARKLGADSDPETHQPRKAEDSELLQSIIEPLEQEIAALKHKLRDTDTRLQETLKAQSAAGVATASQGGDSKAEHVPVRESCSMCANYEKQLVAEQANAAQGWEKANRTATALQLATEELEGVRSLHDETIRSSHAERQATSERLSELGAAVDAAAKALDERASEAEKASQRALETVTTLTVERETLQKKLDTLERDNAALVGEYCRRVEEIQNEIIDLPDTVEDLQEHCLQIREQLVAASVGRERALAAERGLLEQLQRRAADQARLEGELQAARAMARETNDQLEQLQAERAQLRELADKLRASTTLSEQLLEDKKRMSGEALELRGRVAALQQELDNSEKVQQDFVRLSQSLQVQLQRIREADSEVRWQHDEDVGECPACRAPLNHSRKKVHCRHCGRIFCNACVCHVVSSGPRGLPARVCAVCRTLLQPHTAPYFSTDPPRSPD